MPMDWADDEDEATFAVLIGNVPNALTYEDLKDLIGELTVSG